MRFKDFARRRIDVELGVRYHAVRDVFDLAYEKSKVFPHNHNRLPAGRVVAARIRGSGNARFLRDFIVDDDRSPVRRASVVHVGPLVADSDMPVLADASAFRFFAHNALVRLHTAALGLVRLPFLGHLVRCSFGVHGNKIRGMKVLHVGGSDRVLVRAWGVHGHKLWAEIFARDYDCRASSRGRIDCAGTRHGGDARWAIVNGMGGRRGARLLSPSPDVLDMPETDS